MLLTATLAVALIASAEYKPPAEKVKRLNAFILKRQPRAKIYAGLLAERIFIEAKRHGMKVHELASVSWIESDYNVRCKGKAGEHGVWQLMPWEHGMAVAWKWLQAHPKEFPIVKRWPGRPWRKMRKRRIKVLRDIRASTYLAAYSIQRHVRMCRRLGHRVGKFRCNKPFLNQCSKRHKYEMDRIGHYNSGISWPKAHYLRKLRGRSRLIKRVIDGKRRP